MDKIRTGAIGEVMALNYLSAKGYLLRHQNWRIGKKEIDLVMEWQDVVVFVEVKTRKSAAFGNPEESVGYKKKKALISAANAYLTIFNLDKKVRFDIVSIVLTPKDKEVFHIEDAFYPYDL
jgi:putative endonuclease